MEIAAFEDGTGAVEHDRSIWRNNALEVSFPQLL
jgi:hypothetical protein